MTGMAITPRVHCRDPRTTKRSRVTWLTWLLRTIAFLALAGVVAALATSPSWTFDAEDDVAPPFERPAVASAIPSDADIAADLGVALLRLQDGLPEHRLFNSTAPVAADLRAALDGAWQTSWSSPDALTDVRVQVVGRSATSEVGQFLDDCEPIQPSDWPAPVTSAGYFAKDPQSAGFCVTAVVGRTEVFLGVVSGEARLVGELEARTRTLFDRIAAGTPAPVGPEVTRIKTPHARARLNAGLLAAVIALPLLWAIPTLVLDRATWQRLGFSRRPWLRRRTAPGVDVDPESRRRLWAATALAAVQLCGAAWVLRASDAFEWSFLRTGVAVVGVVLAITALPRWLHLRHRRRSRVFAGRRLLLALLGAALGITVVVAVMYLLLFAVTLTAFGPAAAGPDYFQARLTVLVQLLLVPLLLCAVLPLMFLRRLGMRSLRTEAMDDPRPPVLLLRSFADDQRRLRSRSSHRRGLVDRLSLRRFERVEEVYSVALGTFGPVLAVGQVGERLPPPLGAVRRQFSNEQWQDEVASLMQQAGIICVTVGRSAALAWEVRRIVARGHLDKTVFVFPPTNRSEHRKRLAVLGELLELPWSQLDVTRARLWALAVMVPEVGRSPLVLRARAQEDVGYDIALEHCAAAIAGVWALPAVLPEVQQVARLPAEIYPAGAMPVFRPILRRRSMRYPLVVFSGSLVTLSFTFLAGEEKGRSDYVPLSADLTATSVAVDTTRGDTYVVLNRRGVSRVRFDSADGDFVTALDLVDCVQADDGLLLMASAYRGTLQAYDVDAGRVLWSLEELPGVRSLQLRDGRLSVVVPSTGEVRLLDARSGRTLVSTTLTGVPWASTLTGDALWVTLFEQRQVVQLTAAGLSEVDRLPTGPSPAAVAALGATPWVYSAVEHTLRPAVPDAAGAGFLLTRNQNPALASNGEVLAIEGVEMVTILTADGTLRRERLSTRVAADLVVAPGGAVVLAARDRVIRINVPTD